MATDATIGAFGGSTLTLTGNVDKNGTTVTFLGNGAATNTININGGVSGSDPDSDLIVDNVTTNVNSDIHYNGPTFVRNGGILNVNPLKMSDATTTAITVGDTGTGTVHQYGDVTVDGGSGAGDLTGHQRHL